MPPVARQRGKGKKPYKKPSWEKEEIFVKFQKTCVKHDAKRGCPVSAAQS
jgi:hypothetical protein